jgi:hypothetical protein
MAVASYSKSQQALIDTHEQKEDELIRAKNSAVISAVKWQYKYEEMKIINERY